MSPPNLIPPSSSSISAAPTMYLGPNTSVKNTTEGIQTTLPIKTTNVFTTERGLNVHTNSGTSSMIVNSDGDIITAGQVMAIGAISTSSNITATGSANSSSINVNTDKFTVSSTGLTTIQDNLVVGSHFTVTKSSGAVSADGNMTVGGSIYSSGTVTVGGTQSSPNMTLGNDGHITAAGDLTVGSSAIVAHAGTGNVEMTGQATIGTTLSVNSGQFVVDSTTGKTNVSGETNIGGNLNIHTDKFNITASSGNFTSAGSATIASNLDIGSSNFHVTASSGLIESVGNLNLGSGQVILNSSDGSISAKGNLKLGSDFSSPNVQINASSGALTTNFGYASYIAPSSSDNTTTTSVSGTSPDFTSTTSQHLATQTYVDRQLWKQTVRINTILGSDDSVLTSFNNVFKLVQAIEGDTTASAIGGLVSQTSQVSETVSEIVATDKKVVLVNCASSVWADECMPLPIPASVSAYNLHDGWYFKNCVNAGSGTSNKINWYLPVNGTNMKVSDLKNLYIYLFAVSDYSLPYISIYTQAKGNSTDIFPGLANARINHYFANPSESPNTNTTYCLYTQALPDQTDYNYSAISVQANQTSTANHTNYNNGTYGSVLSGINTDSSIVSPTDKIAFIVIQTASTASVNDVEFVLNSVHLRTLKGTTQLMFQNAGPSSNYMFNTFFQKNSDFSSISSKNTAYLAAYNAINNSA